MRPEAEGGILVTARELEERLSQELAVTDWRAVVAVVVAAPGLAQEAEQACERAVQAFGLGAQQVIQLAVGRDEASKQQLEAINRARDTLLPEKRLVWLRAASAADVRFLRKTAPDITSAIDVFVELRSDALLDDDWPTCRAQLRALMVQRHGTLDFTGLLPATVDPRQLPLSELYQPLVDPWPAELDTERLPIDAAGLLVLGHPGTGKSTFVRHLAWTYAQELADPLYVGAKVPLLLSLSDYGHVREHDRVVSIVEYLPHWLAEQGIAHAESLTAHLPEVVLLLDGLDELRTIQARRSVLTEVSQLLREQRLGAAVVTGRSFLVDELHDLDIALRLTSTRTPSERDVRRFLTKFVELRRGASADTEHLVRRVERDHDLRALAETPLMLAFMAILDELEGRLPDRRIEIYYRLSELLVDRWTRARSMGASGPPRERPTRADALRVLGPLAWWTIEEGGGVVSEAALLAELERLEARRETREEARRRAAALLELLRSDTALLVPRGSNRWSFVHRSVAEYFAGVEAERDRTRWRDILEDPFRPEWREIVLFCAGQLGVIDGRMESLDTLVEAMLRRPASIEVNHPSLLVGLLQESPGLSRRQIDDLVRRLLEWIFEVTYPPASALQTQAELVSLLIGARGPVAESLGESLREWLSGSTRRIDWERLMNVRHGSSLGISDLTELVPDASAKDVAYLHALGPFITWLCLGWSWAYEIDPGPVLVGWRRASDWRLRFADWLAHSQRASFSRPFSKVARVLDSIE